MTDAIPAGVIAASASPLKEDLSVETQALAAHVKSLLEEGCDYVSVFGTTGEAPSLGVTQRTSALDEIIERNIAPKQLIPGTGAAAIGDAVALTRHAAEHHVAGLLIMPPFYFPDVGTGGLVEFFRPLAEIAGANAVPILLYNYPRMTKVPLTVELIQELRTSFGDVIAGIKDSGKDWQLTRAYLEIGDGFAVFPGNELILPDAVPFGAAGTITGTANTAARQVRAAYDELLAGSANGPAQKKARALREIIDAHGHLEAQKYLLHLTGGDAAWGRMAPPLRNLSRSDGETFCRQFRALVDDPKLRAPVA